MEAFVETVLVVEDQETNLKMLVTVLEGAGLTVETAPDGEGAIEQIEQNRYAVLLVDKNLPGIDGIEVIRRARELQPFCSCIVMTGFASEQSAIDALRLGAVDYVEKPFRDIKLIAEKIKMAIENERVKHQRAELEERLAAHHAQVNEQGERQATRLEMLDSILASRVQMANRHAISRISRDLEEVLGEVYEADLERCPAQIRMLILRIASVIEVSLKRFNVDEDPPAQP